MVKADTVLMPLPT